MDTSRRNRKCGVVEANHLKTMGGGVDGKGGGGANSVASSVGLSSKSR